MYDDNLNLTRSDTRSDWITTLSPGFTASLIHPRYNLALEYQPAFVYFLHNPQFDNTGQHINFNTTVEFTPRLIFSLDETYRRSDDLAFEEMVETDYERSLRRDTRTTINRNIFSPRIEYRFGSENLIRLYYRNTSHRSEDHAEDDYRENYIESELEYWFNVRNAINLTSHFTKGNFDLDTDILYSVNISARYIRRFTPHFRLFGEYGAGVTDFEERRFFESLDARREFQVGSEEVEDYDLRKFNVGFEWLLPQNLHIEGFVGYYWRQGVGNRDDQGLNALIELEKTAEYFTFNIGWEKGYTADFFSIDDAGFSESWRFFSRISFNYHERLELSFRGSYGYREFTDSREEAGFEADEREDYKYVASTQFIYHIIKNYFFLKDLSLQLRFNHVELDSSLDTQYYINNKFIARITGTF